jgi:hypothetical protein
MLIILLSLCLASSRTFVADGADATSAQLRFKADGTFKVRLSLLPRGRFCSPHLTAATHMTAALTVPPIMSMPREQADAL